MMDNIELVVTGTGRCGTGYVSEVLNRAGVPTGHEQIFTPYGIAQKSYLRAESSWLAVPHLHKVNCYKLGIWRDKDLVVSSLERIGMFGSGSSYDKFASKHGSQGPEHHYEHWNKMVKERCNEFTHIGDIDYPHMSRLLSSLNIDHDPVALKIAFQNVPNNYNTR